MEEKARVELQLSKSTSLKTLGEVGDEMTWCLAKAIE